MIDKIKELIEDYKFIQVVKFIIIVIIAIVLYRCTASLFSDYAKEYIPEDKVVKEEVKTEEKENEVIEEINENVSSSVVAAVNTTTGTTVFTETPDNTVIEELTGNTTTNTTLQNDTEIKEVTEKDFEKEVLKSDKLVIVEFYADWCSPCKTYAPILEHVANENPNIKIVKVDVDNNSTLATKYGAYSIPRTVVFKDGELQTSATGILTEDQLNSLVDEIK